MVDIRTGIKEVVEATSKLPEGGPLNLYYSPVASKLFVSKEELDDSKGSVWIALLAKPINDNDLLELVNLVAVIKFGRVKVSDDNDYTEESLLRHYTELGFEREHFQDFLMSCYLWQVYTKRDADAKEPVYKSAIYIGSNGNTFAENFEPKSNKWFRDIIMRDGQPYIGIRPYPEYAAFSIYKIGAVFLTYYRIFRKALKCQNRYLV